MLSIDTSGDREVVVSLGTQIGPTFRAHLFRAMQRIGLKVHATAAQKIDKNGGILNERTGNLRRAMFDRVEVDGDSVTARVGFDLDKAKYGRVQELGGEIHAVNAQNLTIPLAAVLTGNLVARFTARDVIANPHEFGFETTFIAKGVIFGRLAGMGASVKSSAIVALFALKPRVTIPAHHVLSSSLDEELGFIDAELTRVVDGAN